MSAVDQGRIVRLNTGNFPTGEPTPEYRDGDVLQDTAARHPDLVVRRVNGKAFFATGQPVYLHRPTALVAADVGKMVKLDANGHLIVSGANVDAFVLLFANGTTGVAVQNDGQVVPALAGAAFAKGVPLKTDAMNRLVGGVVATDKVVATAEVAATAADVGKLVAVFTTHYTAT